MAEIRSSVKQPFSEAALARMEGLEDPRPARLADKRGRHFWQLGGGYDRNVHPRKACMKEIDYIHNNPVEAGLVSLPWEWQWSSAGWYEGRGHVEFEVDRAKY
jgi:putative transposase